METKNKFSLVCTAKNKSRNKNKGKTMVSLYFTSSYTNTEPKPFLALQNEDSYCRYPPNKDSSTYVNSECLP